MTFLSTSHKFKSEEKLPKLSEALRDPLKSPTFTGGHVSREASCSKTFNSKSKDIKNAAAFILHKSLGWRSLRPCWDIDWERERGNPEITYCLSRRLIHAGAWLARLKALPFNFWLLQHFQDWKKYLLETLKAFALQQLKKSGKGPAAGGQVEFNSKPSPMEDLSTSQCRLVCQETPAASPLKHRKSPVTERKFSSE